MNPNRWIAHREVECSGSRLSSQAAELPQASHGFGDGGDGEVDIFVRVEAT